MTVMRFLFNMMRMIMTVDDVDDDHHHVLLSDFSVVSYSCNFRGAGGSIR